MVRSNAVMRGLAITIITAIYVWVVPGTERVPTTFAGWLHPLLFAAALQTVILASHWYFGARRGGDRTGTASVSSAVVATAELCADAVTVALFAAGVLGSQTNLLNSL